MTRAWWAMGGWVLLAVVTASCGPTSDDGGDPKTGTLRQEVVTPPTSAFLLRAGDPVLGTGSGPVDVTVPPKPPRADIEIAIDTTGSMQPSIDQAKLDATNIVTNVQGQVADTHFAVVQFRDAGDSPEYQLVQPMTAQASDVQTAINGLSAGGGGDLPEAYNLVFQNSYNDPFVGWRNDARKFVIVIGDAQPHGNLAIEGLTGCQNVSPDPHGLVSSVELAAMNNHLRTLMMIFQQGGSSNLTCYQSMAARGFAGGAAVLGTGSLDTQIVDLIHAAFATVTDLHLEVAGGNPNAGWISFAPPARGPIPAPSSQTFTMTVTVPPEAAPGSYTFDLVALADGADVGHQIVTVVVTQKLLTLTPASATRTIGAAHTVVAHVADALGPYVGDAVVFTVAGVAAVPMSGTVTTNAGGDASFTLTNSPPNPGVDTIGAKDGQAIASAQVQWVNQPPSCGAVTLSDTELWPPNHQLVAVRASGATDPDPGDAATLVIDGVTQDEPINGLGDGDTSPDAVLSTPASAQASIRSERSGRGDGRVYRVHFTATDRHGASCSGVAAVGVPHDRHDAPVDSAPPSYNSLAP